jgi:hypothetical protein
MRSLRFLSLTAAAFLAASSMAQAAPVVYRHVVPGHQAIVQQEGPAVVPRTEGYVSSEIWPSCRQGAPFCTAAGYPNLSYQRQIGAAR